MINLNDTASFAISDLYTKESPVTPLQSAAFNGLLTDVSKHLYQLQQEHDLPTFLLTLIKDKQQISNQTTESQGTDDSSDNNADFENLVHNWQILLNHIYSILLPELYVFFHDDTCTTRQRHKIHKATNDIWQLCKTWQFDQSSQHNYTPQQKLIISQNSTALTTADDYLIGRGEHADIACKILPLAKLSDINGFHYLEKLQPLFQVVSEKKWLQSFLLQNSSELINQLKDWQSQRLATFSVPDAQMLYAQPELLRINNEHPLVCHIQQNMGNSYIVKVGNNSNQLPIHSSAENENKAGNQMVVNGHELTKGILFSAIGFGLVLFDPVGLLNVILALVAIPFLIIAPTHLASVIVNRQDNVALFRNLGTALLFSPVLILLGGKFMALAIFGLVLGLYLRMSHRNANSDNLASQRHSIAHQSANQSTHHQSHPSTYHSQQQANKAENATDNILLPINLHRHAFHLAQLLSAESLELLQQLISAINTSHSHLDYLQEHHPYLANSVHELIMDLTINSILRLNQMAQNLVKNGRASDSAKQMFATNHEQQVKTLLQNHLEEMQSLNDSILEKQMAGFATVGSEAEIKFRDSVMELKILLKWFIAQAPDNSVSSYEIILNKLEESTLKQMQEVFYQHDTTVEQRAQLQAQIDDLLAHFQAQSPKSEHQQTGDDLLQLTHDSNILYQSETQQFIDFNKQYVKQLKQHWH